MIREAKRVWQQCANKKKQHEKNKILKTGLFAPDMLNELKIQQMRKIALISFLMMIILPAFSQGSAPLSKGGKQLNFGIFKCPRSPNSCKNVSHGFELNYSNDRWINAFPRIHPG